MQITNKRYVGVAIGSGGVYSAAGLGVIGALEEKGYKIPYVGGASAGAIIAALYYLECDASSTKKILLNKLPEIQKLKFNPLAKPVSGQQIKNIIDNLIDNRNWKDRKTRGVCFGAAYLDNKEPVILTKDSGLSLSECVLASISFKMIEPTIKLNGKLIAHGGDPYYINGLRKMGTDFIIEVSPNVRQGVSGKIASLANSLSSLAILKNDFLTTRKAYRKNVLGKKPDFEVHPSLNIFPLILPLSFTKKNLEYLINYGRIFTKAYL